jgi:hypothetical protein
MLQYPNDRHNGYVLLTNDGKGNMYVPEFTRCQKRGSVEGNAMEYAGAFLVLARRLDKQRRTEG